MTYHGDKNDPVVLPPEIANSKGTVVLGCGAYRIGARVELNPNSNPNLNPNPNPNRNPDPDPDQARASSSTGARSTACARCASSARRPS